MEIGGKEMIDQTVKELEKMGIKQPKHKAWDRCGCEDCTAYKLKLEIFQKGREMEHKKITPEERQKTIAKELVGWMMELEQRIWMLETKVKLRGLGAKK